MMRWQKVAPMMVMPNLNNVMFIRCIHSYKKIPVEWKKPGIGWTKLNFDGSCKGRSGVASIGGVVRNHKAEFLLGYAEPIGTANSTIAELMALRRGLELMVENGWNHHVWVEGDAKTLVDIMERRRRVKCMEVQRHVSHINRIIMPEMNKEEFMLTFIYREGNRAADKFAQMGHALDKPTIWRHHPPNELLDIVNQDAQGMTSLRTIRSS